MVPSHIEPIEAILTLGLNHRRPWQAPTFVDPLRSQEVGFENFNMSETCLLPIEEFAREIR